jgi:Sulfotransferase family
MSLPDFVYIGPDKAGSSWLHDVLRTHPQVFLTPAKGLYFFDRYYDRGMGWYVAQFDDAGPEHLVRGEVCTDYLAHPDAAARMARALGEAKLMVTLRDPAERAFSSYLHMLRSGWRAGTFAEALSTYPELLDHGRYGTQLERFRSWIDRDALHIAVFDDLQADPQAFVDAVTTWLGIEPLPLDVSLREPRLPAGAARSVAVSRIVSWGAHVLRERDRGQLVGRVKRVPLVQRALYQPLADDRPRLTDEGRAVVHAALADEVLRLDEAYGLDLAHRWGWQV